MSQLRHPNIVQLILAYETPTHYFLVMELVTGGELFERLLEKVRSHINHACCASAYRPYLTPKPRSLPNPGLCFRSAFSTLTHALDWFAHAEILFGDGGSQPDAHPVGRHRLLPSQTRRTSRFEGSSLATFVLLAQTPRSCCRIWMRSRRTFCLQISTTMPLLKLLTLGLRKKFKLAA